MTDNATRTRRVWGVFRTFLALGGLLISLAKGAALGG